MFIWDYHKFSVCVLQQVFIKSDSSICDFVIDAPSEQIQRFMEGIRKQHNEDEPKR